MKDAHKTQLIPYMSWMPPSCTSLMGFPDSSLGEESSSNAGDLSSIPGLGRSPGEGQGYLLQYSGLENSMGCIVLGVAKSRTQLSFPTSTFFLPARDTPSLGSTVRHALVSSLFPLET